MGVLAQEFYGFKYSRVKVCVVVVNGLSEEKVEERERFWNNLDTVVERVHNGYIVRARSKWMGKIG